MSKREGGPIHGETPPKFRVHQATIDGKATGEALGLSDTLDEAKAFRGKRLDRKTVILGRRTPIAL